MIKKGGGLVIEHIVVLLMAAISGAVGIGLLVINLLYDRFSEIAQATVTEVVSGLKYYDSTTRKRIAYDYIYEYTDVFGQTHKGKILRNLPEVEFNKGNIISIRYLKKFPSFSMHEKISIVPYIALAMSVVLFLIYIFVV